MPATFDFIDREAGTVGFVYKNNTVAYYFNGTTSTRISDDDFPGVIPVASITRSGSTATFTASTNHDLVTGDQVIISGATQTEYNGTFTVTVTGNTTFTYTVSGTPATPATGTIIANQVDSTVRGIIYLDGTYYVMTPDGAIYGSAINDPTSWSALNVIQCQAEPDGGVGLFRTLNLVVAFNSTSTEFFYNAGNAVGSPLLPYTSAFIEVGCAQAYSVAQTDNTLYFMGVTKQKGRGIYRLNGTSPEYISTPFIDRILNNDDLSSVNSIVIRIAGHSFYVLYLGDSDVTLVYDATTQEWANWTIASPSSATANTSLTWANRLVTVTKTAHGYNDGDLVTIAGVTPSGYNGNYTINVIDADTFTYDMTTTLVSPATVVGTSLNYVEAPFTMVAYTSGDNLDIVQDSTTGYVYFVDNNTYQDNGNPIEVRIRTPKYDAGNNLKKFVPQLEIIGDKVDSTAYVRYTNDDYQTWSYFRPVDLDNDRSLLNRMSNARRRAYEIRHHDNVPLRLEALEINPNQGTN
jgi:hypothetical protein